MGCAAIAGTALSSCQRLLSAGSVACPQKKVEYVLQKAGAKGQMAIIGFLILILIVLIFLVIA